MDFTTVRALLGLIEVRIGAVFDAFSRSVVASAIRPREPTAAWTARLLVRALRSTGAPPVHLITDRGTQFTSRPFARRVKQHGIRHRFGAVGTPTSIAPIERFWRTLETEGTAGPLLLWLSPRQTAQSLQRWTRWYNAHRPHQGLRGRSPDDVLRGRPPPRKARVPETGRVVVVREHLEGDGHLPIYRLRVAA